MALSATLPRKVLSKVRTSLHFKPNVSIFNTGNDRTNIRYEVSYIRNPRNPYKDLECVLDFKKKTIIYVNSILEPNYILAYFKKLVPGDIGKFSVYHAYMSQKFKTKAMKAFRDGSIRVLVSTEAAGM
ncbi:ATP-dependent DNA helicase sgs1, partial [Mortierella sp. AD094]